MTPQRRMQPDKPIPFQRAIELGKHGGARKVKQGDNVTLKGRGNSEAYTLARLDRDGHAVILLVLLACFAKPLSVFQRVRAHAGGLLRFRMLGAA